MKIIHNKTGHVFPPVFRYLSFGFMVIGVAAIVTGFPLVGILVILASAIVVFSTTGIDIDPDTDHFREYTSYLGITTGKWQEMTEYPFLAILKRRFASKTHSRTMLSTDMQYMYYDLCLLNSSHHKKILVYRSEDKDEAVRIAEQYKERLGRELVNYNPVVSAKTRARRRR